MQLTTNLHMLPISFQIPAPAGPVERSVNIFLVCGEELALVDSGVSGSQERVFAYIREMGRQPQDLRHLIFTHSHPDHVGAAKAIKEVTGCTVWAHALERPWIEDVDLQAQERPVPGFHSFVGGSVGVDRTFAEGDKIDLGGVTLEVIETPGHSAGSVSIFCHPDKALITGDAVPVPNQMPVYDDFVESVRSLHRLKWLQDAAWLLSAWDAPKRQAEIEQSLNRGLNWLEEVHQAILRRHAEVAGHEPMDLCRLVVTELGLPPSAANPLVARSLASHRVVSSI